MRGDIRIRIDMGGRALEYCRAHDYDNPAYHELQTELEKLTTRARDLQVQEQGGFLGARAASASRSTLRRKIREKPLRHLVRIARALEADRPDLARRFELPASGLGVEAFLSSARAMANEAKTYEDVFIQYGLPQAFVADLNTALDEFAQAAGQSITGTRTRVAAHAELVALSRQIILVVKRLDAIIRYRFQDQPEELAAWASARNVAWPVPTPAKSAKPAA